MKKYFVLFMIPAGVIDEWKKNTAPEKMKAASQDMMMAWQKWMSDHAANIVERGGPLGKTKRVTANVHCRCPQRSQLAHDRAGGIP